MTHPVSRLIALLTFFLLLSAPGWAQNTAELQGRVVDPAGHPAVSAFVIITSHDTSLTTRSYDRRLRQLRVHFIAGRHL